MNRMQEVAQMLGVELGEEFKIKGLDDCIFTFNKNELLCSRFDINTDNTIIKLIKGELEIIKKPFRPKFEEKFYFVNYNGEFWKITETFWDNSLEDLEDLHIGNCFKTMQEVEQNKQKIIDLLSPYMVEVE